MMIKFATFFFILSLNVMAEPCSVELYSKIYRFEKDQFLNTKEIIKSSNCSEQTNSQISKEIGKRDGAFFISEIEREIGDKDLHITPRKLSISNLSDLIREQQTPNTNLYFFNIKSLNSINSLSLSENESIKSYCESCTTYGEKNIKIEIYNPITNLIQTTWIGTKLFAKIKVFKAKHALSFQQKNLSEDDFYSEDSYTIMPESILGSLEHINFYKPNKTIVQGSTINNMDIQPVNLVNFGVPAKIILKNQNIGLTKMAVPTRAAQYGESVELKVGTNKTISGKVVDYNQVVIEL